jgi:hypothetical protein
MKVIIPGVVRNTVGGGRVSCIEETGGGNGAVSTTIGMKEQTTNCIYILKAILKCLSKKNANHEEIDRS